MESDTTLRSHSGSLPGQRWLNVNRIDGVFVGFPVSAEILLYIDVKAMLKNTVGIAIGLALIQTSAVLKQAHGLFGCCDFSALGAKLRYVRWKCCKE